MVRGELLGPPNSDTPLAPLASPGACAGLHRVEEVPLVTKRRSALLKPAPATPTKRRGRKALGEPLANTFGAVSGGRGACSTQGGQIEAPHFGPGGLARLCQLMIGSFRSCHAMPSGF
ncbi:unnamed protein product [Durusdinium trenchii]|uniref:Uncharacterized protein n=1 Tax=Durusdinium trenchii TaxID=1381693 RepID=A0ABP0LZA7_9DINO